MSTTYTTNQRLALQDEHAQLRRKLQQHETTCATCFYAITADGLPCDYNEEQTYEVESIEEALGWTARDRDHGSNEHIEHHWWHDATVNPWQADELTHWDAVRDDLTGSPDDLDLRVGTGRQRHVNPAENAWLDMIASLGNSEDTKAEYQAALRVWFPQRNNPRASANVAIYRTFITTISSDRAEVYCAGCKRHVAIRPTAKHIISTLEHAISHAPANVQRGVNFFTNPDGERSFDLNGSTAPTTNEWLEQSFTVDAERYEQAAKQAYEGGNSTKGERLSEVANWYRKAAVPSIS